MATSLWVLMHYPVSCLSRSLLQNLGRGKLMTKMWNKFSSLFLDLMGKEGRSALPGQRETERCYVG